MNIYLVGMSGSGKSALGRALAKKLNETVAAEVYPFQKFWIAEDYHQDYEKKHPGNSYIQNVSIPRYERFKAKFPELIKEQ